MIMILISLITLAVTNHKDAEIEHETSKVHRSYQITKKTSHTGLVFCRLKVLLKPQAQL